MTKQQKILATAQIVVKLRKGQTINFINPVAHERAKIMVRHYLYQPFVVDSFTLKPNNFKA
jgi:hypothetical protein